MRNIDAFYAQLGEPARSCLEALRVIILTHDSAVTETMKYGMPFFCINKKKLCYFWIDKKTGFPYIGFKEGKLLAFPWLDPGDRSTISVMHIDPNADLPLDQIQQTLSTAISITKAPKTKFVRDSIKKAVKKVKTK